MNRFLSSVAEAASVAAKTILVHHVMRSSGVPEGLSRCAFNVAADASVDCGNGFLSGDDFAFQVILENGQHLMGSVPGIAKVDRLDSLSCAFLELPRESFMILEAGSESKRASKKEYGGRILDRNVLMHSSPMGVDRVMHIEDFFVHVGFSFVNVQVVL